MAADGEQVFERKYFNLIAELFQARNKWVVLVDATSRMFGLKYPQTAMERLPVVQEPFTPKESGKAPCGNVRFGQFLISQQHVHFLPRQGMLQSRRPVGLAKLSFLLILN